MKGRTAWRFLLLVVLLGGGLPRICGAATFTVTNTNDSGSGSLRQAILNANSNPGFDTIVFSIGSGPQTIAPLSPLPTITDPVVIDGTTQPGYAGTPLIELSGVNAGTGTNGLWITAGNSVVQGLAINRFQAQFLVVGGGNGILLQTGGGNMLWSNFIGTSLDGLTAAGNGGDGVLISDSSTNTIGVLALSWRTVISGNANGVRIIGNSNGNGIGGLSRIGTNVGATAALPNLGSGIVILGGSGNSVSANVISGNAVDGVVISGGATGTVIERNNIGTNADGTVALANGSNGIEISGAGTSANVIGGRSDLQATNVISGNGLNGILMINGTTGNKVLGNWVGTDGTGLLPLGNGANGIIVSGASSNTIGHPSGSPNPSFGNVICANGTNGIRIRSGANGNLVQGNRVGINTADAVSGNGIAGVQINDGATANTVGGAMSALEANWISGNIQDGVLIADAATAGNSILGNLVGLDPLGRPAPNGGNGIRIAAGASGNGIGNPTAGGSNQIAWNALAGVFVESGTGNAIRGNSIFGNGALGIDLAPAGVTANDHCDADSGANGLQNFPVLVSALSLGDTTTIMGNLDSTANSPFTLDFYANNECDPSGFVQGRTYVGSAPVTTDGTCAGSFRASVPLSFPVRFVTATATDSAGNTSEFSACLVVPASFYTVTPCRVIDTRGAPGPYGGPALAAGAARVFVFGGQCGIPPSAKAVAVNLAVTQPTGGGHLRAYPADGTDPHTATINYSAGQTRANNAIVTPGQAADIAIFCQQGSGSAHLVVDVTGYFE